VRHAILCGAIAGAVVVLAIACAGTSPDARNVETMPDRASFAPVADLLVHRCGTLDCHGATYRDLRLYGSIGLRLSPGDRPVSKGQTTQAEYDEDYASVVGLEPEVTSAVVSEGGASPERLTLIRKARGTEAHKGGTLWHEGDSQDRCVTSWLAGNTDVADCQDATDASF
jgi:hypothetical protein